jgi:nitroreductase/NAD-dependent dihydropyrimidine dehydrogenase PreA subunit
MKPISIDSSKCTICGLCLQQCSSDKIVKLENKIIITETGRCIACGHCYAVCPTSAIVPENRKTPERKKKPDVSPEAMLNILRSRRSHRTYLDKPVEDSEIKKLADFGRYAPTGSNTETVQFLFVKDKAVIKEILKESMNVYKELYRLLNNPFVRFFGPIFSKRMDVARFQTSLRALMKEYDAGGDPIFFKAPVIAYVYADKDKASTPYDDCCYATYNMILGVETLGLSSCLNTRAVEAVNHSRTLKKMLGFTGRFKVYTCTNVGYPKYSYTNLAFRKDAQIRIV